MKEFWTMCEFGQYELQYTEGFSPVDSLPITSGNNSLIVLTVCNSECSITDLVNPFNKIAGRLEITVTTIKYIGFPLKKRTYC